MKRFIKDSITLVLGHNVLTGRVQTGIGIPTRDPSIELRNTPYPFGGSLYLIVEKVNRIINFIACQDFVANFKSRFCNSFSNGHLMRWAYILPVTRTKISGYPGSQGGIPYFMAQIPSFFSAVKVRYEVDFRKSYVT